MDRSEGLIREDIQLDGAGLAMLAAALYLRADRSMWGGHLLLVLIGPFAPIDWQRAASVRPCDFRFESWMVAPKMSSGEGPDPWRLPGYPVLSLHQADVVPASAGFIDRCAPVSGRPMDDTIKSLLLLCEFLSEKVHGLKLGLGLLPIRDAFFYHLLPFDPLPKRGRPNYNDGLRAAACLLKEAKYSLLSVGVKVSNFDAARLVISRVGRCRINFETTEADEETRVFGADEDDAAKRIVRHIEGELKDWDFIPRPDPKLWVRILEACDGPQSKRAIQARSNMRKKNNYAEWCRKTQEAWLSCEGLPVS